MQQYTEGTLRFSFADAWHVKKYDESAFYRKQFQKLCNGKKAVDFIAIDENKCAWLIEVKDYRLHDRQKSIDMVDEFCEKVVDTLAGILTANFRAVNEEQKLCRRVIKAKNIRVVLHLELPQRKHKLFPKALDLSNLQMKIQQKLRVVDPHGLVMDKKYMRQLDWQVDNEPHNP